MQSELNVCIHIRTYVCVHIRTYVCVHIRTYVCVHIRTYVLICKLSGHTAAHITSAGFEWDAK